ncbi:hypothetical protein HMPREF3196_01234 [Bifidobacterium bifidum]|uniref:Uncharacterized protein n=1 Tax=Bifidobacterium bifidum TaxID=1681 RepID=A0A133KNR5_BIFBI|nr:hypothetical protein HMPREF3196_01234 [Bifidobacterium bifidum]
MTDFVDSPCRMDILRKECAVRCGESSLTAVFRYCWMTMMFLARGPRIGCGIAE